MFHVRVINNGDHAAIVWFPTDNQPIPNCRGFTIQRSCTRGGVESKYWLRSFVGFAEDAPKPPMGEDWRWPIQRYLWWDYHVQLGDVVRYRVVPVVGPDAAHLALAEDKASDWTAAETISGQDGTALEAYFNRGIIASQWVSHALADEAKQQTEGKPEGARAVLIDAIAEPGNALRNQLSGLLRVRLLELIDQAPGKIFAVLYELNDPEVLAALEKHGQNANVVLANGAFKPPANDENAEVRAKLRADGTINLFDRMVSGAHFAHNKFIVFCDAGGAPSMVWTGSTNLTKTGLCTQANNGLLIKDAAVANAFLQEWQRLHAAGNAYPPSLAAAHAAQQRFPVDSGGGKTDQITVWFAPTPHGEDMDHARALINAAKDGILFLNFNPGAFQEDPKDWTLLQTILNRHQPDDNPWYAPDLYIRGVVNQEIAGLTSAGPSTRLDPGTPVQHPVMLYNGGQDDPHRLEGDVLVPSYVRQAYPNWHEELKGASSVMIHSKVVILDPFGDHPVVMTGSHNQGMKASRSNDDNLVIVEGNAALAQAYAINAIAIYQEYRWRHYVSTHGAQAAAHKAWVGLQDTDAWQASHLARDAAEMAFWLK